jgi:hypothetical protein
VAFGSKPYLRCGQQREFKLLLPLLPERTELIRFQYRYASRDMQLQQRDCCAIFVLSEKHSTSLTPFVKVTLVGDLGENMP